MLKFIRRNAGATWVKGIFGTIVIIFIFWGIGGGMATGRKEEFVAKVNDETIDSMEFRRTHDNLYRMYESIYKDNFKPELAKMLDLKGKAVDQLIRDALMRQEAARLGLRASDTEVRNAIAGMKSFQSESGGFDKDLYVRVLMANRLTPGEFETSQREAVLVNKLQDVITAGIHVSEAEALERYHYDNDKITLKFIKFEPSAFMSETHLTDDETQKHYDTNKEQFREAEKVRIDYINYAPEKVATKIEVSDTDVQAFYDAHKADYDKPEQVSARHILVQMADADSDEKKAAARKKAEDVLAKAKAGEDFAELAKANSEDELTTAQGGDLGTFWRGAMVPPFDQAVFALQKPGDISDIVQTQYGLHVIKLEKKIPASLQTVEQARKEITDKIRTEKSHDLARDMAYADQGKAQAGTSLADLAQAAGLKLESPEPFAQTDSPPGIGRGPLPNAAFMTEAGKVGPVAEAPTGYFLFIVKERIESRIPPLNQIKEKVESALREKKAEELAKSKADAALVELRKAGDIDAVAQSSKVAADETVEFSRQGSYISKIGNSPELKKAAFKLTREQRVAPEVYAVSGSSVIAVLKDITTADEEKFKSDKDNLIRQTEERRKGQALEEFTNYLKARATIVMNQDYLAAIPDTGRMLGESRGRR